jgi:hypothetical protein
MVAWAGCKDFSTKVYAYFPLHQEGHDICQDRTEVACWLKMRPDSRGAQPGGGSPTDRAPQAGLMSFAARAQPEQLHERNGGYATGWADSGQAIGLFQRLGLNLMSPPVMPGASR